MIDICPVGALTSKPFRYAARTWELSRRKSVSPHDALGSNLVVQVKGDRVLRVLPLENEAVNECWISDKDRFSYEALASDERLTRRWCRRAANGRPSTGRRRSSGSPTDCATSWRSTAAPRSARSCRRTRRSRRWRSRRSSRAALGSDNIDFRLRQTDFRGDGQGAGIPWLGMPVADLDTLDRVLVVGSFLRKDHPLIAQRLRQAAKNGAQVSLLHSVADDSLIRVAHSFVAPPSVLPLALAEIVVAAAQGAGQAGARARSPASSPRPRRR